MTYAELLVALIGLIEPGRADVPVRLIVNGTAYPVEDVWFEPRQDETGAICIGDDPR